MHRRHLITCAAVAVVVLSSCGDAAAPPVTVRTTPAEERSVQHAGAVTVRGDYAPAEHGPYPLHGRYRVRFLQRGSGVDWTGEVPFTAHLETAVSAGPAPAIPLFERAARTGTTTIRADGRFLLTVDYGDSPYEVVLTPVP
jgi:hypothetical protein